MERVRAYVVVELEFDHVDDWLPSRAAQAVQEIIMNTPQTDVVVHHMKIQSMDLSFTEAP